MAKRGGYRPGSGPKPKWNSGDTKAIRVPVVFADRLLALARFMDEDGKVRVYKLRGSDVVHVADLPHDFGCVQVQSGLEWLCTSSIERHEPEAHNGADLSHGDG